MLWCPIQLQCSIPECSTQPKGLLHLYLSDSTHPLHFQPRKLAAFNASVSSSYNAPSHLVALPTWHPQHFLVLQLLTASTASLLAYLQGSIPECFTQPKGLLHLYLSDNALSGPLPDFSADSSLQLLFARDQFRDGKPSLGGSLPASLAAAKNLQYLQLSNTGLTGGIGELPAGMK